jgi:hypothetical protein
VCRIGLCVFAFLTFGSCGRAQTVVQNPTGSQTITQPVGTSLNVEGGNGRITQRFNNIRFADQFPGGDCGAKIQAADLDLFASPPGGGTSNSGEIWVRSSCGAAISNTVSGSPSTLVIHQYHVLRFMDQPAGANCYQLSTKIQLGDGGGSGYGVELLGNRPSGFLATNGPICIQMAAGANLPVMIQASSPQGEIHDMLLDGNKAANPIAGTVIQMQSTTTGVNSAWVQRIDHVTIQNSRGFAIRILSTGNNGETAAPTLDRISMWNNELGCIETEHVTNVIVRQSDCENSGLGGGSLDNNFAKVNTAGTIVDWFSGPTWTGDSSIVGRTVVISGARYTVATVASGSSLTLSSSAGTQSNVIMQLGTGIELFDSRGSQVFASDVSASEVDGIKNYGVTSTLQVGAWGQAINSSTFTGNIETDVWINGFDAANANYSSYGNQIINNYFGGHWCDVSTSTYRPEIYIQDSSANLISGNTFYGFLCSTHGLMITETVAGREGICPSYACGASSVARDYVSSNNLCYGTFSGGCISQNVQNPPVGTPFWGTTGLIGGSALAAGTCATGSVTIGGNITGQAIAGMPAVASPSDGSDIGQRFFIKAYATSLNTVTVSVCAVIGGTPPAKTYNVRLLQ